MKWTFHWARPVTVVMVLLGCSSDPSGATASTTRDAFASTPSSTTVATTQRARPVAELEPVLLWPQAGSRAANNVSAASDHGVRVGIMSIDEAAFFASDYEFVIPSGLVRPEGLVGYRSSQVALPSDATVDALAAAFSMRVPIERSINSGLDDIAGTADDETRWEGFDSSTGQFLELTRLPPPEFDVVNFRYSAPGAIPPGYTHEDFGDVDYGDPPCKFTEEPDPDASFYDCRWGYYVTVDEATLPTEAEAEEFAATVMSIAYPDADKLAFETTATPAGPESFGSVEVIATDVSMYPIDADPPGRIRVLFGRNGEVHAANGQLGGMDRVAFPLVGLDDAVERLNDPEFRWLAPAGIVEQQEPHSPEPSRRVIDLVEVRPALWHAPTQAAFDREPDGFRYAVPAYAFIDADGDRYIVPAITDEYLLPRSAGSSN